MRLALSPRLSTAVLEAGAFIGDDFFPVAVWLTVYGVTRLAPSLILRLSMSVPQSMDMPPVLQWRRRPSRSGLTADELAARLADLINETPSGTSSSGGGGAQLGRGESWWSGATVGVSETLSSLASFPQRLLTYLLFQRTASLASSGAAGQAPPQRIASLLLQLVTSFTSLWVHANGSMLFDTVVTYLTTRMRTSTGGIVLGGDRSFSASGGRSGWRDLLIASCIATSVNLAVQTCGIPSLTALGERRTPAASRSTAAAARGVRGHDSEEEEDGAVAGVPHVLLSTLSRLGVKDSLYRLSRLATGGQHGESRQQMEGARHPSPSSPSTSSSPSARPPRVFLCGGNALVFALSGFRFGCYAETLQLTTAVSNFLSDGVDVVLRQARHRAAARRFRAVAAAQDVQTWRPPASLQAAGLATAYDVVIAPAASLELLPIFAANFAVGACVGVVWQERRLLVALGRHVPLLRGALAVLLPLPPAPLHLPEALQELSPECHVLLLYASGRTEVVGEERAAPIIKTDGAAHAPTSESRDSTGRDHHSREAAAAVATGSGGAAGAETDRVVARVVAEQDLFCPIKRTLMSDPVRTVDGFTYDRDSIEEWLRVHETAPLTNLHLSSGAVSVNWPARRQVEQLVQQYAEALAACPVPPAC